MSTARFNTGKIVSTMRIGELIERNTEFAKFVSDSMRRHVSADWGDLDENDKIANEEALDERGPGRIVSAYNFQQIPGVRDTKIHIITEWDRSVTTISFPSEY